MRLSITEALGIYGLSRFDAPILAALATHSTVLLIGPHGSAKTMLAEKLGEQLDQSFRHYNASLLNYDDLVGFPVPDQEKRSLEFIQTPGTIWKAGFVLFDEISRAKPEVQNKIFPIVYEHRIQGIKLEKLRHCWAAMNPPSDGNDYDESFYSGSWPLDLALSDRFQYVLEFPSFSDMGCRDRKAIIKGNPSKKKVNISALIKKTQALLAKFTVNEIDWISEYLNCLIPHLESSGISLSGRRVRYLAENIVAVYAAETVLGKSLKFTDIVYHTLSISIPLMASGITYEMGKVILAHKAAVEETGEDPDSPDALLRKVKDSLRKVKMALSLDISKEKMCKLVSNTFAGLSIPERFSWVSMAWDELSADERLNASTVDMLADVMSAITMGYSNKAEEAISHSSERWDCWQNIAKEIAKLKAGKSQYSAAVIAIGRGLFWFREENIQLEDIQKAHQSVLKRWERS